MEATKKKSFLQKLFLDKVAPLSFWPIAWQTNGTTVIFYVDEYKVAEKLLSLDKQVQLPTGYRLIVKVHPGSPNISYQDLEYSKEKLKLVLAKRYNTNNKALDLSKFHADPELQDMCFALYKPIILSTVMDIVAQNIPDLEAISLNNNRLMNLETLKNGFKKTPHVKILHLANNKIRDVANLDALMKLPVIDLVLDGNPLCNKFRDKDTYISEVRKRFPKCIKLDGIDLPPPISFDISEETHLPDGQQTFLCNSEGEVIVRQFLEQYFQIYDTENRQPLLQAYHEHAVFSLTMAYPYGYGKEKNVSWLNWYNTDNRNILKLTDGDRRFKLLRQGHLSVVSYLQEMPQTKHDIHSFTVDLTIFTPHMISLTISGMYKELKSGHKIPPTRFFFRTLVIVPAGTGFCIANDLLHVSNATPDQAKEAFKTPSLPTPPSGTAAPPSTPEASPIIPPVSVAVSPILDKSTKEEMVKQIALKTGMNWEWSLKCLEGNDWDFVRAVGVFENLQSQGRIPVDAFVK